MGNKFKLKKISDIKGTFCVPSYQRGYRWGKEEIERLLNDILENGDKQYCLQPVVVLKKDENTFELVDGQQRLTTIFLIYKYMHNLVPQFYKEPSFKLTYDIREKSEEFLNKADENSDGSENIDFYYFAQAYKTIAQWFAPDLTNRIQTIFSYLDKHATVIWYEIEDTEDPRAIFKRLNKDKIYLTSSELVKALFINKTKDSPAKQDEIALQWDNMEKELHEKDFWFFLTNQKQDKYPTRIDLVLDLMAGKKTNEKQKHFTFFHFSEKLKNSSGKSAENNAKELWADIQNTFLTLKDWHEDRDLYHKIGFLIASGHKTLADIFKEGKGKTKTEFKTKIEDFIKESVGLKNKSIEDLSYDKNYDQITKILLLFNVETIRKQGGGQRFEFSKYKEADWTLEHIHAQNSEGLTKQEDWKIWLKLHKDALLKIGGKEELIGKIDETLNKNLTKAQFDDLQTEVIQQFNKDGSAKDGGSDFIHSIKNLALLRNENNIALSNSVFSVKRNKIIEMDKKGEFIPFCTKMVFLKYYSPEDNQLHFWTAQDRENYFNAIKATLSPYLREEENGNK